MPTVTDLYDVIALCVSPCKVRPAPPPKADVARAAGDAGLEESL
jgi:hypothetical protein